MASLWEKRAMTPRFRRVGAGAALFAPASREAASAPRRMCLNIRMFHDFAMALSNGTFWLCRKEWKPMRPRPDRALARGGIDRAFHFGGRARR